MGQSQAPVQDLALWMTVTSKPAKHWSGLPGMHTAQHMGAVPLTSHIRARLSALARPVEPHLGLVFCSLCWERLPVQARGPASPALVPSLPLAAEPEHPRHPPRVVGSGPV